MFTNLEYCPIRNRRYDLTKVPQKTVKLLVISKFAMEPINNPVGSCCNVLRSVSSIFTPPQIENVNWTDFHPQPGFHVFCFVFPLGKNWKNPLCLNNSISTIPNLRVADCNNLLVWISFQIIQFHFLLELWLSNTVGRNGNLNSFKIK